MESRDHATVHVDARTVRPRFHCWQEGGRFTLAITASDALTVYLDGTHADLVGFLDRVGTAVPLMPTEMWAEHRGDAQAAHAAGYFDRDQAAS